MLAGGVVALIIVLGGILFAVNPADNEPNTNEQSSAPQTQPGEQKSQSIEQQEEELTLQPDINNEEFILVSSDVSCSPAGVNGGAGRNCSGNIRIIPAANESMEPGLYKINAQTKLLHAGQEQDLSKLRQLAQDRTKIRLTLAAGSEAMLSEIRY